MAKKINIQANLDRTNFDNQMKNLQNGNYNVNVNVSGSNNINNTTNQMKQLNSQVYDTNSVFGKIRNTIANVFSSGKAYMTGYLLVLREINEACKNAKQSVEDIDSAITDLSVATGQSREATAELVAEYNKLAKQLRATTTDVTSAADDYLRAGKTMSEAEELIQDSIMLSKLGQIDSSEATEDLLATMNGFNMSVEEVGKALDAMVAIDMEAATSSGDIATALKYCASNADMAGVSFNTLASMIGTVQDKTQQSAQTIGTYMNTLLSRYKDVKLGNYLSSEDGEDISDYESVLKSVGIAIRDSAGEFKDYESILSELANTWNTLSSVQQAAVAKVSAGTRQQNRFYAMVEGYNKTLELTEVAANSAGTAIEKYNNSYVESIDALKNELQASFETLVINSNLDDVYKDIIKATTAMVDFVNEWSVLKGITASIAVSGLVKGFLTLKTGITQAYVSLNQFQSALNLVNSNSAIVGNDFTRLLLLTKNLSESQTRLVLSSKTLTLTQKQQILVNQGLSQEEARLKLQNMGLATSYTGLKAASISVSNALKGLWATIKANPMLIVTTAVSAVTIAYQKYKQSLDEAEQAQEEARQKSAELASTYRDEQASLDSQIDKYKELKEELDKGNLSTDDARDIKEQLLEIQQSLIDSYGDEAYNLDLVNGKYKEQLGLLNDISKEKAQAYVEEHRDDYNTAKEELEKTRQYDVGYVTNYGSGNPETDAQKQLIAFLTEYSDLVKVTEETISGDDGSYTTTLNLEVNADVESADEVLRQLSRDLENWGNTNDIDVSGILTNISTQLKDVWTDELEDYKTIYDEYIKADIIRNDTLRPLYYEAVQAVEDYNNALSNGDGVEEAKANLDSVKESFAKVKDEVEGSDDVFNGIYDNVNSVAEADYNLTKAFDDLEVQKYAKQLRGLTDIDLKNIRFDNDNIEEGEQSFKSLMDVLGLTTDDTQTLIDKLVELGYVTGKSYDSTITYTRSDMINAINDLSDGFDVLSDIYKDVADGGSFDFAKLNTSKFQEAFSGLEDEYANFIDTISQSPNDIAKCQQAFDNLTTAYILQSGVLDKLNDDNAQTAISYLELMNVQNAEEIVSARLKAQNEYLAQTGKELKDATTDEIVAFLEECEASDETRQYLAQLELSKISVNNVEINTSNDIDQIITLAEAAGAGAKALAELAKAKAVLAQVEAGSASGMQFINNGTYDEALKTIEDIENGLYDFDFSIDRTKFEINAPKDSSSSSSTKKSYDWIEKAISNLEDEYSRFDKIVGSTYATLEEKNDALAQQLDITNAELQLYQKAYDEYMKKADSISLSDDYKELVRNGAINIETITDKNIQEAISDYEEYYNKAKDIEDSITDVTEKQLDIRVTAYDSIMEEFETMREQGAISEKEYVEKLNSLWEAYYENQVKLAEVAKDKKIEILNEEKNYIEGVASSASSILSKQSDVLDDVRDNIIDGYNEQISTYKSQISELEALKKPLQEQLDLITEQQNRESKILALQEAQYNLARAENQKSVSILKDGQIVRTTKNSDIADARQEVKEAELELQKYEIQQQIDAYDKQIEAINDMIDSINDLIDSTNDYYDKQIDALEKVQNKFDEFLDMYEYAQDIVNLKDMFGDNALQTLLSGDVDAIQAMVDQLKQSYTDTLVQIDDITGGTVGDITKQFSEVAGTDLSPLVGQTSGVTEQFNTLGEAVDNVSKAISGTSSATQSSAASNGTNASNSKKSSSSSAGSLTSSVSELSNTAGEDMPLVQESFENLNLTVDESIEKVDTLQQAIDGLPENKTITIDVVVNGADAIPNAKGTKSAKRGLNLVGEEEPEAVVTNDGNVFVAEKPTLLNMQGGETVYNGSETKELVNEGANLLDSANISDLLEPLPEDYPTTQLIRKIQQSGVDISSIAPTNLVGDRFKSLANGVMGNVNTTNNNDFGYKNYGDINITCTGVTSQEVAKQIGTELEKTFFGMSTRAYQRSKRSM